MLQGGPRSFFSEIISSISDVRFSRDGRHMLSRDYMTVKLWDINMEKRPVASFPVHEPLREKVIARSAAGPAATDNRSYHLGPAIIVMHGPRFTHLPEVGPSARSCCGPHK